MEGAVGALGLEPRSLESAAAAELPMRSCLSCNKNHVRGAACSGALEVIVPLPMLLPYHQKLLVAAVLLKSEAEKNMASVFPPTF